MSSLYSTYGTNSCQYSAATNSQQKRTVNGVMSNNVTISYSVAAPAVCGCTNTQVYGPTGPPPSSSVNADTETAPIYGPTGPST